MINLSEHFTLAELTFSQVAARMDIYNVPDDAQIDYLVQLCEKLLEPARIILGAPLHVDSGYRSSGVNAVIGGAKDSAHMDGRAADLIPLGGVPLRNAFDALRTSQLPYDQLIIECNAWIHIAIAPVGASPRRQALTASGHAGAWTYQLVA